MLSGYEVIIVDNGSSDDTRNVAAAFCRRNAGFCYIQEPDPGVAIARNAGVRISSSEIVAFADDDTEPEPSWLQRILTRFQSLPSDVAVIGGEIVPVWDFGAPPRIANNIVYWDDPSHFTPAVAAMMLARMFGPNPPEDFGVLRQPKPQTALRR